MLELSSCKDNSERRKWLAAAPAQRTKTGSGRKHGAACRDTRESHEKDVLFTPALPEDRPIISHSRLLAVFHTAFYCSYLTFSINTEDCVWPQGAAKNQYDEGGGAAGLRCDLPVSQCGRATD